MKYSIILTSLVAVVSVTGCECGKEEKAPEPTVYTAPVVEAPVVEAPVEPVIGAPEVPAAPEPFTR